MESESSPGSSSQLNNRNNNHIHAGSEIPPVSSLAIVPYHDKDGHDNKKDIDLGSDTPPVSSSPIHDPSNLGPISPALPTVKTGAVLDSGESSNSPESLRDTRISFSRK